MAPRRRVATRLGDVSRGVAGWDAALVALLAAIAVSLGLWGITRDLPYVPEVDEPLFVAAADSMARTGTLDPGWFGHPGSTVVYPLAALSRAWRWLAFEAHVLGDVYPPAQLAPAFPPAELYLIGRLLSVAYLAVSIPLTYLLGRKAFDRRVGLAAAAFAVALPIVLDHARMARTDVAAMAFTLLTLVAILRELDRPSLTRSLVAGACLGLTTATRYFMVTLAPALVVAEALAIRREGRRSHEPADRGRTPAGVASGLLRLVAAALASIVAFAAVTPYFILRFQAVVRDLRYEARTTHLGADGLSALGNARWYVSDAVPDGMSWPLAALALGGIAIALARRREGPIVLLSFVAVLWIASSLSALHWARWTIQALPVLGVFAASALVFVLDALAAAAGRARSEDARGAPWWALAVGVAIAMTPALRSSVQAAAALAEDSTRVRSRAWLLEHAPPGAAVAVERFSAPLLPENFAGFIPERRSVPPNATGLDVTEVESLAVHDLEHYRDAGIRFLVTSGSWFGPILADPAARPEAAAFYRTLAAVGELRAEFGGSHPQHGPLIRIYELPP